jgi:hypothetical protein
MPRFHATPTGPVPYTAEEEAARDAEEAADAAERKALADAERARLEAEAADAAELAPIREALAADRDLTREQLRRALRHLLRAVDRS